MSTLSNAPLIETYFELRWGTVHRDGSDDGFDITIEPDEEEQILERLQRALSEKGYSHHERINVHLDAPLPFLISHRFRKTENAWPLYQLGTGIFAVNQINAGYEWETFEQNILEGLHSLEESTSANELPVLGVELRYIDGFAVAESEDMVQAMVKRLAFSIDPPKSLLEYDGISSNVGKLELGLTLKLTKPKGQLIVAVTQGKINGEPGFIMHIAVRSIGNDAAAACSNGVDSLTQWLKEAKIIHRHAFKTLIDPEFARTFQ